MEITDLFKCKCLHLNTLKSNSISMEFKKSITITIFTLKIKINNSIIFKMCIIINLFDAIFFYS